MNCHAVGELLSGWIDGELPADEVVALEGHLSDCAECRALAEGLRVQDADLRRAFQPQRQAAVQVASRVLESLDRELQAPQSHNPARAAPRARFGWGALLLAAAAGFLLALVLVQPWMPKPAESLQPRDVAEVPAVAAPIAHLVVATGNVEMRPPAATDWLACADIKSFRCPSGSEVRTGPDVRCELKTSDGCVIRLNQDTQIALASPRDVTVRRGQIWCSSPENVSLKIVAQEAPTADAVTAAPKPAAPWSCASPSTTCLTAVEQGGDVQVLTSAGETELHTPHDRQRLRAGERARVVSGQIVRSQEAVDPILAAGWVHSLLIRKGREDGELAGRINDMLSQVGRSKVAWLYEQEIRGLGEYAVLPLLRFVQSPQSREEHERRLTAMRLVSDLAPSWAVPELVALLADEDPQTRVLAATALARLTGLDQGRPPAKWREDLLQCGDALARWKQWLAENRHQYPPPPATSPMSAT